MENAAATVRGSLIRPYQDLREWLQIVDEMGELKVVEGADWNLELAAITELVRMRSADKPALLFDRITGYPAGHRVLTGMINTLRRLALTLRMPIQGEEFEDFVQAWKRRVENLQPVAPREVRDGPILENVQADGEVDLHQFPTPFWHEEDGGRYLGTGSVTITRDPDEGWVNLGTYRVMIHDRQTLGFYASPGKHGRLHREQFWQAGKPCPVVISFGHEPLLWLAGSSFDVPWGTSELSLAGAVRGEPLDVIAGDWTGLPIPAHSEIVAEGESVMEERVQEGPFGEFTGYYASGARVEPVVHVKRLYYRNNPIITGSPPARPPSETTLSRSVLKSAGVWTTLERAGLSGIRGVCMHPVGATYFLTAVSIRQRYAGHAKQAGMLAASVHGAAYMSRFVVVVDEDINPFNLEEVLWALCTRCHPHRDINVVDRTWSGPLDPMVPPGAPGLASCAIIDATRPWEWKEQFPPSVKFDEGYMAQIRDKWAEVLGL